MNLDRTRVFRKGQWNPDHAFGLDGPPGDLDRENVLDLLTVVEDERRFHAAAALLTEDPIECARYRAMAREATALLADIRHGLARITQRHLSRRERSRQLQRYASRLMARSQRSRWHALSSTTNLQGARS